MIYLFNYLFIYFDFLIFRIGSMKVIMLTITGDNGTMITYDTK